MAYQACHQQGIAFIPVVVESLGGFEEMASKEVKKLASALARHMGEEEGSQIRRTFARLSVLLMKGNAAILSNRIPSLPELFTVEWDT